MEFFPTPPKKSLYLTGHQMICSCTPRPSWPRHDDTCLVAQAMRWRCPDCRAKVRFGRIFHSNHCELKEYQP